MLALFSTLLGVFGLFFYINGVFFFTSLTVFWQINMFIGVCKLTSLLLLLTFLFFFFNQPVFPEITRQFRIPEGLLTGLPKHWRRRPGRPRQTWLRTIENDLRPLNLGLATAQRRAQNRTAWQTLVETATSLTSSR